MNDIITILFSYLISVIVDISIVVGLVLFVGVVIFGWVYFFDKIVRLLVIFGPWVKVTTKAKMLNWRYPYTMEVESEIQYERLAQWATAKLTNKKNIYTGETNGVDAHYGVHSITSGRLRFKTNEDLVLFKLTFYTDESNDQL
jgi:hypothetical protein